VFIAMGFENTGIFLRVFLSPQEMDLGQGGPSPSSSKSLISVTPPVCPLLAAPVHRRRDGLPDGGPVAVHHPEGPPRPPRARGREALSGPFSTMV